MGRSRRRRRSRYPFRPPNRTPSNDDGGVTEESETATLGPPSSNATHQDGCGALYVDVVKKRHTKKETLKNEFSISKEHFPALPGTELAPGNDNESYMADDDTLYSLDYSSMEELVNYDGDVEHDDDGSSLSDLVTEACRPGVNNFSIQTSNCENKTQNKHNDHETEDRFSFNPSASYVSNKNPLPPPGFNLPQTETVLTTNRTGLCSDAKCAVSSISLEAEELRTRIEQILAANKLALRSRADIPTIYPTVLKNKYGMLALANSLRTQNTSKSLTINDQTESTKPALGGVDATKMGINFFSKGQAHASFAGPFTWHRCKPHEIIATVPHEYLINGRVRLHPPKVSQMEVELLFYFFYLYPGDMMQMLAAAELSERSWLFHIEHKIWLRHQDDNPDYRIMNSKECGIFNYFSYNLWKVCEHYFELDAQKIEKTKSKIQLHELYGDHPQLG